MLGNASVAHPFSSVDLCLESEEITEDEFGAYHADEVYFEAPDLSGGVEGVDYIIAYGADDVEEEEEVET